MAEPELKPELLDTGKWELLYLGPNIHGWAGMCIAIVWYMGDWFKTML